MASHLITSSESPSMITTHSQTPSSSSSGMPTAAFSDDGLEDGCSICLEPFTSQNPPTVTSCNHEYHLQCILEWSQRSKECPNCWQLFVLIDPTSQELLTAVESERSKRSRSNICIAHQEHEINHDAGYVDDSDFEERILQHFAAAKNIANLVYRRRQTSSGIGPSHVFPFIPVGSGSNIPEDHGFPEEFKRVGHGLVVGLPPTCAPSSATEPASPQAFPSADNQDGSDKNRIFFGQPSPAGPRTSSSSELLAFSDSVKAKLSAASTRYKESISKGTLGLKEKLLAKNGSVKELGREVKREVSAGIAGVARMIERFDRSSKKMGASVPLSSFSAETSNLAYERHVEEENNMTHSPSASLPGKTSPTVSSFN